MSLFKRKPKIIKGHSFHDYLNHYSKGYINAKNEVIEDKKKLKPNCRYYEINGKYYQIDHSRWIRNTLITLGSISLVATIYLPIHFMVIAKQERYVDYQFKYWNECESLNKLKQFVKETVTPSNKNYVPKIDRIATFDMDGTLFGERSPIYIEWMMFNYYYDNLEDDDPHKTTAVSVPNEYKEEDFDPTIDPLTIDITPAQVYSSINDFMGTREDEPIIDDKDNHRLVSLEMGEAYVGAQLFADIKVADYCNMVEDYLDKDALSFNNLKYKDMFYKPMIEVVEFLQQNNFDVYVVSGTDRFMVRTIVNQHLNIPYNKVIGMDVSLYRNESGETIRGNELKYKNVKEVKAELIAQEIGTWPILSFGNSSGDIQMHEMALNNQIYPNTLAFMNVANDVEREWGYEGEALEKRIEGWADRFELFWMREDWKTIYGDNVTIKPQ